VSIPYPAPAAKQTRTPQEAEYRRVKNEIFQGGVSKCSESARLQMIENKDFENTEDTPLSRGKNEK
jgi:hypothetical protein